MWPFGTKKKVDSNDVGMLAVLDQPPTNPTDPDQASRPFYQPKVQKTYPAVGDVFRGVSFGMSEDEFHDCMRADPQVRIDDSSSSPLHHVTMFGTEFLISPKYLHKELFRLFLYSDGMRSYSDEIQELQDACVGMMEEKYGPSTGLGNTRTYYNSGHCWDFNGKVIEVSRVMDGKYCQQVVIVITSTAMEDEAKKGRIAMNKAEYSKYGAYF